MLQNNSCVLELSKKHVRALLEGKVCKQGLPCYVAVYRSPCDLLQAEMHLADWHVTSSLRDRPSSIPRRNSYVPTRNRGWSMT
jgi:hypothetical protein